MGLPGGRPITRDKAIEIAHICHGLSQEDATKYIDTLLARGERQIRFHYELVDIEPLP